MQTILSTVRTTLDATLGAYLQAKALKAQSVKPMIDPTLSDGEQALKLRGSFFQTDSSGTPKFYAVSTEDPIWATRGEKKIGVTAKWGQAAAMKKLSELNAEQLTVWWAGVLTVPGHGAGDHAHELRTAGLEVKILPGPNGDTIDNVNLSCAGEVTAVALDAAIQQLGGEWLPCEGLPGGLEGFPSGGGLPDKAQVETPVAMAPMLGGAAPATLAMAMAAFKAIGLVDAAGNASPAQVGGFLAAAAGEPMAGNLFAVALATDDETSEQRKAARAAGKEARGLLQQISAHLTPELVQDVAGRTDSLSRLGFTVGGRQIGTALSVAVQAANTAPGGGVAGGGAAPLAPGGAAPAAAGATTAAAGVGVAAAAAGGGGAGGGGGAPPAGAAQAFDAAVAKAIVKELGLPADANRMVQDAIRQRAEQTLTLGGGEATGFMYLVPAHAPTPSDVEVIKEIARSAGVTVQAAADSLAADLGVSHSRSVFGVDEDAHARTAVDDLRALQRAAGKAQPDTLGLEALNKRQRPDDWKSATALVYAICQAGRRALADGDQAAGASSRAVTASDQSILGMFKSASAAPKQEKHPTSVASSMVSELATTEFVRANQLATQHAEPIREAHRLCSLSGTTGEQVRAYMISDGMVKGTLPKGLCSHVVDVRELLLRWIEHQIQMVVGRRRVPGAAEAIDRLATAILTIRARATSGEAADDDNNIYKLSVKLLGGTPPEDDLGGTDDDTIGRGTWGTTAGEQSRVDVPTGMANLARILAAVHGKVVGGSMGEATGATDGLGLTLLARRACSLLTPEKVTQAFQWVFSEMQYQAVQMRTRPGEKAIDMVAIIKNANAVKFTALLQELRAEEAAKREFAKQQGADPKGGGRKSPLGRGAGDDDDDEEKPSKRKQKRLEYVANQREEREAAKKAAEELKKANGDAAKTLLAADPPGGAKAGEISLSPGSIKELASAKTHDGAVEALAQLYRARNPKRARREQQPCPFVAIRHGPDAADALCLEGKKPNFGECAQCRGWATTPPEERVPYHKDDLAKVKAASVARIQKLFASMSTA